MSIKRELELAQAERETRQIPNSRYPAPTLSATEKMYLHAELDAFRDRLKAALTMQALQNTATLSILAERYARDDPGNQEEYRTLVELYVALAAKGIVGGEW